MNVALAGSATAKEHVRGTHRAVPPEVTAERVRPLLDQVGITRVADLTGLDRVGIPVMAAYRPAATSLVVSMGKGLTPEAAYASATMESIELWHAERPELAVIHASAHEAGLDHELCAWALLPQVPGVELDATTPTSWVAAISLRDGRPVLVPYEAVHTDGRLPAPPSPSGGQFVCTSNGLASGNDLVEAVLHGLCEVIERDATTLWRLGGDHEATVIDPATIDDADAQWLLGRVVDAGLMTVVHDVTSDIGVATLQCTLFDADADPGVVAATSGMGCHPSRAVALSRAVTEAAQSRLALISGARDDLFRPRYLAADGAAEHVRRLVELAHVAGRAGRDFSRVPDAWNPTIEGDLELVVAALAEHDLEPLWVELTRASLGIPVGRAVVAGLELLDDVSEYTPGRRARAVLGASR